MISETKTARLSKSRKKDIFFLFKVLITGALLYSLFLELDRGSLMQVISQVDYWWLLAAYGALWMTLSTHIWRWQWLLKAGEINFPFSSLYHHYVIGYFFGHFLPRIIGGDVIRALSISQFGASKTKSITIIYLGRLVGIVSLLLIFVICVVIHATYVKTFLSSSEAAFIAAAILAAITFGFFILTTDFAMNMAKKFNHSAVIVVQTLTIYRKTKSYLIISFFISTLLQITVLLRHYFVAKAVGLSVDFATLSFVSILVMGLTTLPITVNGIGLRENGFVFLLGILSIPAEKALTFSLMNYVLMILMAAVGGVAYLKGVQDHRDTRRAVLAVKEIKEEVATT